MRHEYKQKILTIYKKEYIILSVITKNTDIIEKSKKISNDFWERRACIAMQSKKWSNM